MTNTETKETPSAFEILDWIDDVKNAEYVIENIWYEDAPDSIETAIVLALEKLVMLSNALRDEIAPDSN